MMLYVGRDKTTPSRHDLGSTLCLSMLERWKSHTITVHLATDISPRDRPYWLRGTPTLVDDDGTTTGFAAYQKLTDLAFAAQASTPSVQTKPQPAARAARAPQTPQAVAEAQSTPSPEEDDLDHMWESQGDIEGEAAPALGGPSKLSQDDFAKAMMGRERTTGLVESNPGPPPMLEPLKD